LYNKYYLQNGRVAELADAQDLKSKDDKSETQTEKQITDGKSPEK